MTARRAAPAPAPVTGVGKLTAVYRVVLALDDDDEWHVQTVPVRRVHGNGDILLARPFLDMCKVLHPAAALGACFFSTEEEALCAFGRWQHAAIAKVERTRAEARRALDWLARQLSATDAAARPDRGRRAAYRRGRPVVVAATDAATSDKKHRTGR